MNLIKKIRKWSVEKKRFFAFGTALFLTILIIVFNSAVNLLWKEDNSNNVYNQNSPINTIQESFSKLFNESVPVLEQAFSSTTEMLNQINSTSSSFSTTSEQINSATSSSSTSTNVVKSKI